MQIDPRILEASAQRLRALPRYRASIERAPREMNVRADHFEKRMAMMQLGGVQPSVTEIERTIGRNDLVDLFYLDRIVIAAQAVARISLGSGAATGFMVSPSLMMTNWHVFETAEAARGAVAGFEYRRNLKGEPQRAVEFRFEPDRYFHANRVLDYAVVAVERRSLDDRVALSRYAHLRLIGQTGKANPGEWATIVQHPGGQPLQIAIRENQLVDEPFEGNFIWYLSDTAPGSSGSPVFNDQMQVIALHHSGVARKEGELYILRDGRRVAALEGVAEEDVIWEANEGVRVSAMCRDLEANAPRGAVYDELLLAMQGGDLLERAYQSRGAEVASMVSDRASVPAQAIAPRLVLGGIEFPIRLMLDMGSLLGGTASVELPPLREPVYVPPPETPQLTPGPQQTPVAAERLAFPWMDPDYSGRTGYDSAFIGIEVPLPTTPKAKQKLLVPFGDGFAIPYEHFSLVLHSQRRLALYTATNVDFAPIRRRPEPDLDYTRDGLSGLRDGDVERWFLDERVPAKFQVPDEFYTKDGGAFDKGHLTRRDDVCWGANYQEVRRANGDTYHLTNCSPQRGTSFNRSPGLWGALETLIARQAKSERLCVFAGPVLDPRDQTFEGRGVSGSKLTLQIPERYWKVVIALGEGGLAVFPFVLAQVLSDLPPGVEFVVPGSWRAHLVGLKSLEEEIGGLLKFGRALHLADRSQSEEFEMLKTALTKIADENSDFV